MFLRIKNSGVKEIIDVQNKNDSEIAQLSRDLNIDIAVDLMGFTKHNRIKVFANKFEFVEKLILRTHFSNNVFLLEKISPL